MPDRQEQTQQSDHDLLIELKQIVVTLRDDVRTNAEDVKRVLNNHEQRIRTGEDLVMRINPEERIKRYDKVADEWDNFKVSWKIWLTIAGAVFTFVAAIIGRLINGFIDKLIK